MVCLAAATRVAARRTRAVANHHDLTTCIIAGYTPEARSIYEAETLPSQEVEVSCVQRYIAPADGVVATKAEIESPLTEGRTAASGCQRTAPWIVLCDRRLSWPQIVAES